MPQAHWMPCPVSSQLAAPALRGGPRLPHLVQVHMDPSNRASSCLHAPAQQLVGSYPMACFLPRAVPPSPDHAVVSTPRLPLPLPRLPLCQTDPLSTTRLSQQLTSSTWQQLLLLRASAAPPQAPPLLTSRVLSAQPTSLAQSTRGLSLALVRVRSRASRRAFPSPSAMPGGSL